MLLCLPLDLDQTFIQGYALNCSGRVAEAKLQSVM